MEFLKFFYYFASFVVMVLCVLGYYRLVSKVERAERVFMAIINAAIIHLEKEGIVRADFEIKEEE